MFRLLTNNSKASIRNKNRSRTASAVSPSKPIPLALTLIALAAGALCAPNVRAQDAGDFPSYRFSGFGTLGIVHSSEDDADFLAHDLQDKGAGRHDSWSKAVDSRLGLQLSADFTSSFSAVLQVVSEQQYDGTFRPQVEWANLTYDITPDLSVRAGRIVLDSFLVSNYRKVGYSTPWVRPPVELYSLIPLTKSDGVDVSYHMNFGDVNNTFRVGYGVASARLPDGGKVETEGGAWHLSNTLEYGPATFHMAYSRSRFTVGLYDEAFDQYRAFAQGAALIAGNPFVPAPIRGQAAAAGAQALALEDKYNANDKPFNVLSIGASYDPGKWFVMAEWGQTDSDSIFGKREGWYATGGYRWGKFTPYVTYARADLKSNQKDPGITSAPAFMGLAQNAADLNTFLNSQNGLAGAPEQKTISVGLRWDVAKNTALKLQYDYSRIGDNSPGTLDHTNNDFRPGGNFEVFSATLDFVF